jgi:hypothetical protein
MPAFRELLEIYCSYLKVIGYLYILGAPIYWRLFSVEVCHAMVFSRVARIAGGDGETNSWKFDGPRLTQPPAYHVGQSASPSGEV